MPRLIDADALKKDVEDFPNCYNGWSDTYDKSFIIGAIEEQPSIDIVRCKECKWYSDMWGCTEHDEVYLVTNPDDFCSIGERSDT